MVVGGQQLLYRTGLRVVAKVAVDIDVERVALLLWLTSVRDSAAQSLDWSLSPSVAVAVAGDEDAPAPT